MVWSWGNNKFGQLGHGIGNDTGKRLPKPINYLLTFCQEKNEKGNKVQFDDISCGGFHSLCLAKYKNGIDWIDNDFRIIVNIIKNNNEDEISFSNNIFYSMNTNINNYNNNDEINSENLGNININKV